MWRTLLAVAALVAVAASLAWLGVPGALEAERLRASVAAAGPWGPVVFVALFALLEAVGVPGLVFIGIALVAWPPWQAFLLIWAGALGASCAGFAFARTIDRRWVAAHLPERFRAFDARLATSGLRWVIALRLLFYLATPAHWLLGLSGVPLRTALVGSAIGFLPGTALWAFAGGSMLGWIERQPPATWLAAGAAALLLALARGLWRSRRPAAGACAPVRGDAGI